MFVKGIDQNTNPQETPKGYIYWAKNAIFNTKLDAIINEDGTFIEINLIGLDINFKNGIVKLGKFIILFYKKNSGEDCIAVIDEKLLTVAVKVQRTDFNFQSDKPISGRAKINPSNQLVVAFVDGYNTNKYINLDTALITDALNFYNLFPVVTNASNIEVELIDSGAVPTGAYFITFQYISKDRTRSTWTTISKPTYVTLTDTGDLYTATKGVNSGQASNKLLKVTLSDIDTNYAKVAVAVISHVGGVLSAKLIKEVSITSSTLSFVYNGTESLGTLTIAELVTDNIVYTKAKHITSLDDQLFLAGLTTPTTDDLQTLANAATVKWVSQTQIITTQAACKDGNDKTFIHDEVYALYAQFELADTGTFTEWFHIPGRALAGVEGDTATVPVGTLEINGREPKAYEVSDTCLWDGVGYADSTKRGTMSAWENSNEVYPSNFPSHLDVNGNIVYMPLNTKVRHHKFPSLDYMQSVYGSTYGVNFLDNLSLQVQIPISGDARVKGYRIGYAKRTLADVGVIGMGLTIFAGNPQGGDVNNLMSAGGNFYLACADNFGGDVDNIQVNRNYIRFNSFDIWQDRPSLSAAYLRNYIRLNAARLGRSSGDAGYVGDSEYGQIFIGSIDFDMVAYACNFTKSGANQATATAVASDEKIRKLTVQTYVPHNVKYAQDGVTVDNRYMEETVLAKVDGAALDDLTITGQLQTLSNGPSRDTAMGEETYLAALKNPKSDYFIGFDNQTIITSPKIERVGVGGETIGLFLGIGDGFIGMHSYTTVTRWKSYRTEEANFLIDLSKQVIMPHIHLGVSRHNVNQRYLTIGDYSTYFFPDAGLFTKSAATAGDYWFYYLNHSRDKEWNNFQYSKDFSSVNDLEVFGVYDRDSADQNSFNYRIHKSNRANRESSLEDGWKTFSALDYFDTVRDKGEIINLEAWGTDALLIHHERALFKTRDKAVLRTNIVDISLGSGDIFALEPKEENPSSEGTGGTQHKYSCLLTPIGYVFVDAEACVVYLYDGNQLRDISGGLALFFANYLSCDKDNPLNDNGISIAFDNLNYRLVLSQKATDSFTVSYDIERKNWVCAHDFIPDYIFGTRNKLYSFKGADLYTHNQGSKGSCYGTIYPFYVDFIVNDAGGVQKILSAVSWLSTYKNLINSIDSSKTIDSITIWNDQASTGKKLIITNESDSLFVDSNTKVVDERWSFNDINNNVVDPTLSFVQTLLQDSRQVAANISEPAWYDSEPLRGKYFIVRLEYSNSGNKEVYLQELTALLRKSDS